MTGCLNEAPPPKILSILSDQEAASACNLNRFSHTVYCLRFLPLLNNSEQVSLQRRTAAAPRLQPRQGVPLLFHFHCNNQQKKHTTLGSVSPRCWGNGMTGLGQSSTLGLRSAHRSARAAFWGSWEDCLRTMDIARTMYALESPPASADSRLPCRVVSSWPRWGTIVLIGCRCWMVCVLDRWILTRWTLVCPPTAGSFSLLRFGRHFRTAFAIGPVCWTSLLGRAVFALLTLPSSTFPRASSDVLATTAQRALGQVYWNRGFSVESAAARGRCPRLHQPVRSCSRGRGACWCGSFSCVDVGWIGRRGWQHADVPSGWIQVIRGPRPNSVVWPKVRPQGVRTDPPQRTAQPQQFRQSAAQSVQKGRRLEEFLQCENERLQTPSAEASTRVSRFQAAINSLGDGDAEAKKALESILAKAQKQAEVPHTRQIEETREFIARARKRILHADEKIRLAEQGVAEAKQEKEYDLRELPLAESRLERLQAEERVLASCPAAPLPSDWGVQISSLMQTSEPASSRERETHSRRC